MCRVTSGAPGYASPMAATIEPEPTAEEREAILAALARPASVEDGWASAALVEGVEEGELDP